MNREYRMTVYSPDTWAILRITNTETNEIIYKILAGWYGGYLSGDSWKLNSGITSYEYRDNKYIFSGYSGSFYECHEESERLSMTTAGALEYLRKKSSVFLIDVIRINEFAEEFS